MPMRWSLECSMLVQPSELSCLESCTLTFVDSAHDRPRLSAVSLDVSQQFTSTAECRSVAQAPLAWPIRAFRECRRTVRC